MGSPLVVDTSDQWAELVKSKPAIVDEIPAGWDSARTLCTKYKDWSSRRARDFLRMSWLVGKSERREVQIRGSSNAEYIYRRLAK